MSVNLEKVYGYIDKHFDEHVENVRKLVRQPSISFTNEGVEKCADILVQDIKDLGCRRAERCDFKDGYPVVYGAIAVTIVAAALAAWRGALRPTLAGRRAMRRGGAGEAVWRLQTV